MTNPECWVCNQEIEPGDSRTAEPHPATQDTRIKHDPQGREPPEMYLSTLDGVDVFEVSFNGGDYHVAGVEGCGLCAKGYTLLAMIRHDCHEIGHEKPLEYSSTFLLFVPWTDDGYGETVAYEYEYLWDDETHEPAGDKLHKVGTATVRPTDITDSQIQWDFWEDRPTHPKDLHERYYVENQTVTEMAEAFDVSGWTVRNWMDRVGIPRNGGNNGQTV